MERSYIYILQLLFVAAITLGSQALDLNNKHTWGLNIARYVMYMLTVQASELISVFVYKTLRKKECLTTEPLSKVNSNQVMMYLASITLLYYNKQKLYAEDFPLICFAYLIVKYPVIINFGNATVSLGTGMAISFIEGYLTYILPPAADGTATGFTERIRMFESVNNVVVPVKKLFIIITKTMNSPPDLKEFNKNDPENVNRLEPCSPFEEVVKDVAGVKARVYRSAMYRVTRPSRPPVHVAAECATPLYTLYKAIKSEHVYNELKDVNVLDVMSDFTSTLRMTLAKNPQLADRCELVLFDDTDESLNLSDVLLDRIRELEPNFEQIINQKK